MDVSEIESAFKEVQDHICKYFVETAGVEYLEDVWAYEKGEGGGRTRVWEGAEDDALEKAGVNFSGILGASLPQSASMALKIAPDTPFRATGVSLVIHPRNPTVPTIHMNIRYFECGDVWWFGGGIDLTPYYISEEQVVAFHRGLKAVCERHAQDYVAFKQWCDRYFYLKHRNEARGVGGIFYDHLDPSSGKSKQQLLDFSTDLGHSFVDLYRPFFDHHRTWPYTEAQREFQLYRRSRYVEFNLLFDRGTKFGIDSNGRTESILMSMPAVAKWRYNHVPEQGSAEEEFVSKFLHARDWLGVEDASESDAAATTQQPGGS
eukprot:TRINITY_DN23352_c0_g1_i1.p1 TRINITY_DN23352_c0_g1~~TRINITY_DN23352_c0_g1_i1.p1  ORF type:complete len:349 (-),score=102.65 TRINITY_DN23352_c0_g1_i1:497-1453(-)